MIRYAIYAAPPADSELARLGSAILGYDAYTGLDAPFPDDPAFADPVSLAWSAAPRQYGFHATLKAPFRLAEHATADQLREELRGFAASRRPFTLDLTLAPVGHFLALVPVDPPADLQALADDCVRHFDPYRAPLSPADRERRHPDALIERQVENLDTWGYPFVLDDFQFHMTLTSSLDPDERRKVEPLLRNLLSTVSLTVPVDAVLLFRQDGNEARFVVDERFPFAA